MWEKFQAFLLDPGGLIERKSLAMEFTVPWSLAFMAKETVRRKKKKKNKERE
jgi:hypothetical protein